ncbi:DNA topoisomerase IB [Chitinophaga sp. sic0106]|uniref:DNA topoisomerase IB n=1 Tax=Chitinophaga sp. sic0106 TaxID=2854785 RepID=UPI002102F4AE|nr:DNA topoisomerase IB [Chitinophaga sp. sic0106]
MITIEQISDPVAVAKSVKLRYVKSDAPGITRLRSGSSFRYLDPQGQPVTDEATLERIRKLVLPPAWENVWICTWPNGHLQATGTDTKGRKQYRYHNAWAEVRNETKYFRLQQFGENLPAIRKKVAEDLRHTGLPKDKVIAIALLVMEETQIRVGNTGYEKLYGSHGLTTLRNKHVKITGSRAFFQFKGKKGVEHKIELRDAALARLLKKVQDIPGQSLFQYYGEDGNHHHLDSGEVNDYIKACCSAQEFTCKDFRTWAGTVHAFNLLADLEPYDTITACRKNIVTIIDSVANKLGNTRAVCKKYYVHPLLLSQYEEGTLDPWLKKLKAQRNKPTNNGLHGDEKILLQYLRELSSLK